MCRICSHCKTMHSCLLRALHCTRKPDPDDALAQKHTKQEHTYLVTRYKPTTGAISTTAHQQKDTRKHKIISPQKSNGIKSGQQDATSEQLTDLSRVQLYTNQCCEYSASGTTSTTSGPDPCDGAINAAGSHITQPDVVVPSLPPRQVALLHASWKNIRPKMKEIGLAMFLSIFERYPNIKALFGFSTTPLAELHDSPTLQKHGVRIMQTIDYILNSIFVSCDMECTEVTGLLSELGRSHLNLKVKPEYISVMGGEFVRVTRTMDLSTMPWTDEMDAAWLAMFAYMAAIMQINMLNSAKTM